MELMEAIRGRRSVGKVRADAVDQAKIEQLLEAAVWAPNHRRTEPWKFFVMTGDGRRRLGRVMAEIAREPMGERLTDEERMQLEKEAGKPLRAPVVIAVAAAPSDAPKVIEDEEYFAAAAAVQNMLLAAHALGLGAIWRTGGSVYHPKMNRLFGLGERDRVIGFVYVGYPEGLPPEGRRVPFPEKTVWIDRDDGQ